MSEYQYHEWQMVDRLLTAAEQALVERLSSHIEVSASRAWVEYHWSDFRHDPKKVLLDYFDGYFYMANWGTLILMFRFPKGLVDDGAIKPFLIDDYISFETFAEYHVLSLEFNPEYGEGWMEAENGLSGFIRLREDLIEGDFRLLYLAWLKAMGDAQSWVFGDDDERSRTDFEPPVPPGLKTLSPGLRHFIDVFELDPFLVQAAAEASKPDAAATEIDYGDLVKRLMPEERDAFLVNLAEGKPGAARSLRKRLKAFLPKGKIPVVRKPRAVTQLQQRAAELARADQLRREEAARRKHVSEMEALARREAQAWKEVEKVLDHGRKIASVYDDATKRLQKLEQLADFKGTRREFQKRVTELGEKYARRTALIARWKKLGWV